MPTCKIASVQRRNDGCLITLVDAQAEALSREIATFFRMQGYALEDGSRYSGVYTRGNGFNANRYQVHFEIRQLGDGASVALSTGMIGLLGIIVGGMSMKGEMDRISGAMLRHLAGTRRE